MPLCSRVSHFLLAEVLTIPIMSYKEASIIILKTFSTWVTKLHAQVFFYFFNTDPNTLRMLSTIPLRFSFFSTNLKHLGHSARKLTGRLSFKEPLICSK